MTTSMPGRPCAAAVPARRRTARTTLRLLAVCAVAAFAVLALPVLAGAEESCPPAAGGDLPPLADRGEGETFRFVGRGWGHGIGMSQWGAQGAASLGCSYVNILTTYYPGVEVASGALPEGIRVGLLPNQPGGTRPNEVRVAAVAGDVPWHFGGSHVATQPQGHTWAVRVQSDGSYRLVRLTGDGSEHERWRGGGRSARLRANLEGSGRRVRVVEKDTHYARGSLEFNSGGLSGAQMQVSVVLPSIEHYLYGLREVPASWDVDALKAQAVVGRSYAVDRRQSGFRSGCDCHLFDSVYDQVYRGYDHEAVAGPWVSAVDGTRGETIRYGGSVAVGFYASSHGGHSESNYFVWGGSPLGYLQPVDDSRWEAASDNPNLAWHADFSPAELGQRLGVGIALDVRLPEPKGAAGRIGDPARGAGGFVVVGSERTRTFSGDQIRTLLGLRSTLFDIASVPACVPPEDAEYGDLVERAGGANRYGTAVELSARGWTDPSEVDRVVIAAGQDFPDALAGGALADALDAPLLLTRSNRLPADVADELERLAPERAVLLGGTRAIPQGVEEEIAARVGTVERVDGADRFATAAAVAHEVGPSADGTVILALGRHTEAHRDAWPDALAAGALAAVDGHTPVLLTRPDALPQATRDALDRLDATGVRVIGGPVAVSEAVEAELRALGLDVERLAGPNRYATSAEVVTTALDEADDADGLLFATGRNFPDGLAAGALAARERAPLLLVPHCDLSSRAVSADVVRAHADQLERGLVLGGHRALGERVRWQLEELLR